MDVDAARDALAGALALIELDVDVTLNVYDYASGGGVWPAAIVPGPVEVLYDLTKGDGLHTLMFEVHVVVGRADESVARARLAPFVSTTGPLSIKAALEDDPTLGGAVASLQVTGCTPASIDVAGVTLLDAVFDVEVIVEG